MTGLEIGLISVLSVGFILALSYCILLHLMVRSIGKVLGILSSQIGNNAEYIKWLKTVLKFEKDLEKDLKNVKKEG